MSEPTPTRDDDLSRLLQSWRVESPDDPGLARKVWARIDAAPARAGTGWWRAWSLREARPGFAAAVVAACVAAGALTAQWQRTNARAVQLDRLAAEYAHSIDPLWLSQTDHGSPHHP